MENLIQMIPIRIRDENLTEAVTRYQLNDGFNSLSIKLIKDIIQQQQRSGIRTRTLQETELRQLQGNHITLVLPLTSLALHLIISDGKFQVIPVHAVQGISHGSILEPVALNHLQQRSPLTVGDIMQPHLLLVARYMLVNLLEQRHQFVHKRLSLGIEHFSVHRHLLFP